MSDTTSYVLLIVEPVGQRATRDEAQGREAYAVMRRFADGLAARGKLRFAEALGSERRRLQVRDGQTIDGPYAEAKEMVGGFFLLDDVSFEEALQIAAQCPAAQFATIEVRALGPCFT